MIQIATTVTTSSTVERSAASPAPRPLSACAPCVEMVVSGRMPKCSRRHQHGGTEALHLERPVELVGEHRTQAVRREHREGDEARGGDRDEGAGVDEARFAVLSAARGR